MALLGGDPVRNIAFHGSAMIDEKEILSIMEVFRNNEFSTFAGGATPDINKIIRLKSEETFDYPLNYWNFLGGRKIREFEKDFASYFNVDYAVSINSATSGLSAALAAVGCGPGDEVICPSLSFTATATSILMFNSIPRFADVDPETFCLSADSIIKNINERTKAILSVHLAGNACDMDAIMQISAKYRIPVIEDCAQAPGVKYGGQYVGTIGDIGVFSFQETKNMMTGEGGMIVTNNPEYAARCRCIRNHGEVAFDENVDPSELVNMIGFNLRMTELTAAVGIEQLKKLKLRNTHRNHNVEFLKHSLSRFPGIGFMRPENKTECVYHLFPMLYDEYKWGIDRSLFVNALNSEGIPVSTSYVRLMYENPLFLKKIAYGKKGCPFTCRYFEGDVTYGKGLTPVAEELIYNRFIWFYDVNFPNTIEDMEDVIQAVDKIFKHLNDLKTINPAEHHFVYKR